MVIQSEMNCKKRIYICRLLEKMEKHPGYCIEAGLANMSQWSPSDNSNSTRGAKR